MGEKSSLLAIKELLEAVGGNLFSGSLTSVFTSVATDSRNIEKNSLFVPLIGEKQNGHIYIPQAIKKGASVVFVANSEITENKDIYDEYAKVNPDVCFISVKHTMYALQSAAAYYVKKFPKLIKIGITGSCGKTTTKEILASILKQKYSVITNEGNLNSETGLPLSVFKINTTHQVGIFEMGMNRKGEISELSSVLFPNLAIITNIGTAHIGILGTQDAIAEEKKNIFSHFTSDCAAFIPSADKYASFLAENIPGKVIIYGENGDSFSEIKNCGLDGTEFNFNDSKMILPIPGRHNFNNAIAAISLAQYLGLSTEQIKDGLVSMKPLFGRSQVIHNGNVTYFLDCYNANPDSMEKAIDLCDEAALSTDFATAKKIYILGDMLELGNDSKLAHENVGKRVEQSDADVVGLIGPEMQYASDFIKSKTVICCSEIDNSTVEKCAIKLEREITEGSLVLFKGSRGIQLERIFEFFNNKKIKYGERE